MFLGFSHIDSVDLGPSHNSRYRSMYRHTDDASKTTHVSRQNLVEDVGGPGEAPVPRVFEYIERIAGVEETGQPGERGSEGLNDLNDLATMPAIAPSLTTASRSALATRKSRLASLAKCLLPSKKST